MPSLATVAAIVVLCVLAFALGRHAGLEDAGSPCVVSYETDGRTLCVLTEQAAAQEHGR